MTLFKKSLLLFSIANLTTFANATVLQETQLLVQPSQVALSQEKLDAATKDKKSEKKAKSADKKDAKDDAKKDKKKKEKFKPYKDIVTDKAITSKGVFTTHLVDNKVYFEIPADQFGREFVWQVKTSGTQAGKGVISADIGRQYVIFERHGDYVLLRNRNYSVVAEDGSRESLVVKKASIDGVIAKFPITTFSTDKAKSPVIDITKVYMGGSKELFPDPRNPKADKLKLNDKTALITKVKAFEKNIETTILAQFNGKKGNETKEIRHSIFALPDTPMKPRFYDKRVGYFSANYSDYSSNKNKLDKFSFIKRWRLEKKNPELEVSEPKQPIVWYIDRGTPQKFVEAVREGIEFWQPAFEAAGFKNAIIAKMAPSVEENPDWDAEDARYSVVRWVPSGIPNANGPHVADPRSGEIIEADVRMYHNVIKLLEGWYFAQAGATDPRAKKLPLPNDVMSDLVRFVVAHEVGHSTGLHHNFIGNNSYTIEQLRDPEFVKEFGVSASIMDYARFNYVMQPEDGVSPIDYHPGPYDKFVIEWGYKEFKGDLSPKEEALLLNKIADRQLDDKRLRWDAYSKGSRLDPRILTEAIGDDPVEATRLGQKNKQRILANLIEATSFEPSKGYDELDEAYKTLVQQHARELGHVAKAVGGVMYKNELTQHHHDKDIFVPYPKDKQERAVDFLIDNGVDLPAFWNDKQIFKRIGYDKFEEYGNNIIRQAVGGPLAAHRLDSLIKLQAGGHDVMNPVKTINKFVDAIYGDIKDRRPKADQYRVMLQDYFVTKLLKDMAPVKPTPNRGRNRAPKLSASFIAMTRGIANDLKVKLQAAANKHDGNLNGYRYAGLAAKLAEGLEPKLTMNK
ncbi:zinc-dependent metalloprotease [uncultured Psychrosphaera sp.]|uniref:zinc-dependent metalloprotease n=1 Tax=uncultured Psychrosphaera sp. TaxID=1403522 RepID=UPI0026136AAD|nr:zinc-dependent metalloprotease [uncultured Psychrosphaera sp.]